MGQWGFDVGEGGGLEVEEPVRGFDVFRQAMVEQRVPPAAVGVGVVQISGRQGGELLVRRRGADGAHGVVDAFQRSRVDGEDERVEVRKHVIDGADGAADALREAARPQLRQAIRLDEPLRGLQQVAPEVIVPRRRGGARSFRQKFV